MNNKYRNRFVNSIEEDINQDKYIDPERIAKGIQYLDDAQAVLQRKAERLVKKYAAEVKEAGKNVDTELAAMGIVVSEDELSAELEAAE
tara:strand:- start:335 stop:601 length:267 start_codon:yes stop_codon:yes gene_type:complete